MNIRIARFAVVVLGACLAYAQGPGAGMSTSSDLSSSNFSRSPFLGAVPEGQATVEPLTLSLAAAIQLGLRRNLGAVLSSEGERAARGQRLVALSKLLPEVRALVRESSQQNNLAAFGFSGFPGIQEIVGPFGVFDARGAVSQSILDFSSLNDSRASIQSHKAAEFSYQDARETVVLVVTSLYMQAVSGGSRIEAAKAQVSLAEAAHNQARDRKNAGLLPAIDVLRAQVELQAQRQRLIADENDYEKQKLQLARAVGIPVGQDLDLTDKLPYTAAEPISFDEALSEAYQSRMDYRSLEAQVRAAEFRYQAAHSERLPSLSFRGDYGTLGPTPANSHGTFTAALSLDIPIYTAGKVKGETLEADAAVEQQKAQLADLRSRIGFEIRSAMLDLKAAAERVEVNRSTVDLARKQEEQARDRFAAGVTDNLEVVQAQEALAAANESLISSLFSYNLAKASLARATGGIEGKIGRWLTGETHGEQNNLP
jgi:outer membrane protein TolC